MGPKSPSAHPNRPLSAVTLQSPGQSPPLRHFWTRSETHPRQKSSASKMIEDWGKRAQVKQRVSLEGSELRDGPQMERVRISGGESLSYPFSLSINRLIVARDILLFGSPARRCSSKCQRFPSFVRVSSLFDCFEGTRSKLSPPG